MMVEEQTATRVERSDGGHILIGKREIEDVDILSHTFDMRGFWNDDDASLNQPTQSDLRHAFAVLVTYLCQHRIRKEAVASFGKRCPRHDACAELLHDVLRSIC